METLDIYKSPRWTPAGLSVFLFGIVIPVGIVLGISAGATRAVAQSTYPATDGWKPAGPASGEITALATIRQVVSAHVAGSPAGIHILIDGPLGSFDASLGSFLPSEVLQALSNDTPVQIVGAVRSVNGKNYLMARQLTVGDHVIVIRNSNGFPAHNSSTTGNKAQRQVNGGIQ
jgi:hypothetical protein